MPYYIRAQGIPINNECAALSIKEETLLMLDDHEENKDFLKDSHSDIVTNNGSGNTRSKVSASICEHLLCAGRRISTTLTGVLTKKLTVTADSKKIFQFKSHVLEMCYLIDDFKETVKWFNETVL